MDELDVRLQGPLKGYHGSYSELKAKPSAVTQCHYSIDSSSACACVVCILSVSPLDVHTRRCFAAQPLLPRHLALCTENR